MKATTSSLKSPAPATRPAAAAKSAANAPTTTGPVAGSPGKRFGRTKSPVSGPTRFEAPPAAPPSATIIKAQIDVGFGNGLYLRGEGSGLKWGEGLRLQNVASDLWTITLEGASAPVRFKFLLNDEIWSSGEDYLAQPGSEVTFTPQF